MSHLHQKHTILEVSIESDDLYKTDGYINTAHESESCSFIFHNVHNPEWAMNTLKSIRYVKKIINVGSGIIDESTALHVIKVMYDSDAVNHDAKKIEMFRHTVRDAIERSGVSFNGNL